MENTRFKILSINGFNQNGISALYVLRQIEEDYCKPNTTLKDYFDLIAGSHMGNFLALTISHGIPMNTIVELYEKSLQDLPSLKEQILNHIYYLCGYNTFSCHNKFKSIVNSCFGHNTNEKLNNIVMLTMYNKGGLLTIEKESDVKLSDITLATCSVFPCLPIVNNNSEFMNTNSPISYLYEKNPTFPVLLECMNSYIGIDKPYDSFSMLSVGNVIVKPTNIIYEKIKLWKYFNYLILVYSLWTEFVKIIMSYIKIPQTWKIIIGMIYLYFIKFPKYIIEINKIRDNENDYYINNFAKNMNGIYIKHEHTVNTTSAIKGNIVLPDLQGMFSRYKTYIVSQ